MPRPSLALAALSLPIVGMAGLYGWAATQSMPGPADAVNQYIAAFNTRDCSLMKGVLQPARSAAGCQALMGQSANIQLVGCSLGSPIASTVPVARLGTGGAITDAKTIRANCSEHVAGKRHALSLIFTVGTDAQTGKEVVAGLGVAPAAG